MKRFFYVCIILCAVFAIVMGCAGRQKFEKAKIPENRMRAYLADKPEELKPEFRAILEDGQRNYVLNNMQVGVSALKLGHTEIAEKCFDEALKHIEAVFADNEKAGKARSLWYEEGMKDFKGEPYERAMSYYYRGLLYMLEEDYENARACFKAGIIQDAFAEENQNQCDFALLLFLEAFCSLKLNDQELAKAALEEMKKLRPDLAHPDAKSNVLILVETGTSPRKLADGLGHAQLKFFRGRNIVEKQVVLYVGDSKIMSYPIEDVAWQAMTRGGRPVDKIIKGQVEFRKTHEKIGSTLTDISSNLLLANPVMSNSDTMGAIGAALGIFGVAEMVMASRARTHADTRYWNNLPDTVHISHMGLDKGAYKLRIHYLNENGAVVSEDQHKTTLVIDDKEDLILIWKRPDGSFVIK
ncbi:MAG: hypothetical protein Q7J27_14085 [Syntrophales bacterium]|nr:hypothetical protein [Syntrophales bacterium]